VAGRIAEAVEAQAQPKGSGKRLSYIRRLTIAGGMAFKTSARPANGGPCIAETAAI